MWNAFITQDELPRERMTGIEWLDAVLAIADEITARIIQEIRKDTHNGSVLHSKGLTHREGLMDSVSPRYT
jgi:hypothetical protein